MANQIDLDSYKIALGDTDYPTTHDSMVDAIEAGVNTGITTANAAEDLATALTNDAYTSTSNTTQTPASSGSKVFTLNETARAYTIGTELKATSISLYTNWMKGVVTAYTGTSLTLQLNDSNGTTSKSDWAIGAYVSSGISSIAEDTTPELGGDLDLDGNQFVGSSYVQASDATPGTGTTQTLDYSAGDMQQVTCPASGTLTIAYSGFVASNVCAFILDLVNGGNCTITWPSGTFFADKTAPTLTESGTDRLLITKDKDDVYTLSVVGYDLGVVA